MTASNPERILFNDENIYADNLMEKLLNQYKNAIWLLEVKDGLIFKLTPGERQEIIDIHAC